MSTYPCFYLDENFGGIGQEGKSSQGWSAPVQGQSWVRVRALRNLFSLCLNFLLALVSVFSFENMGVISLVFPILWFGNSQCPIPWCHVEALLTVSAHPEFGNHTTWKENQVKWTQFIEFRKLGENSMSAEAMRCYLFPPASSTANQAPSGCWLKEWKDGIE